MKLSKKQRAAYKQLSLSMMGHKVSASARAKLRKWHLGRKMSSEVKAKISLSLKNTRWGSKNPNWKGNSATSNSARARGRRRTPIIGVCQKCRNAKVERHHKDGNPLNNRKSNIAILCRRCHMLVDGRLEKLKMSDKRKRF